MTDEVRIEAVSRLDLRAGDILHVRVGGDIGEDQPPYIPGPQDLEHHLADWEKVVPDGVQVVATHHLVNIEVVSQYD